MPLITAPSPSVSDALDTRITVRAFKDTPVPSEVLRQILTTAQRSPSGGNLQPWNVHVMTGQTLAQYVNTGLGKALNGQLETPTYEAYPAPLWEPHRTWRYQLGEAMYALLGIAHDDKAGRNRQFLENMRFFGAPVGMIITADKRMDAPQHMDIGIYLQSLMLLAREAGLHTAPQGWWRNWPSVATEVLGVPDSHEVLVGLSLGYADEGAKINDLRADRAPMDDLVTFYA